MEGIWPGHGFVPAHYISTRANTERIYLKVKIIMIWEVLIMLFVVSSNSVLWPAPPSVVLNI